MADKTDTLIEKLAQVLAEILTAPAPKKGGK